MILPKGFPYLFLSAERTNKTFETMFHVKLIVRYSLKVTADSRSLTA
jgi:hypothetical protein